MAPGLQVQGAGGAVQQLRPHPLVRLPCPPQAQTAELRSSIDSIKTLAAALEAGQKAGGGGGVQAADGLTVSELRQELRSFAETLHE